MLDLFGMNKLDAKDSVREIAKGFSLGLIESYTWKISELEDEIKRLVIGIEDNKEWKRRYEELLDSIKQRGENDDIDK